VDDRALAVELVREAGLLAARMLRDGLRAHRKTSVSDVVSAADHAAEDLISARLTADRPGDAIVGEEGTSRTGDSARTWYVDPVDGTYNFLSGLPVWCSALALVDGAEPDLGAVYQPATDELWIGGRTCPTSVNDEPLPPLQDRPLSEVSVASYLHPTTLPDDSVREPLARVVRHSATVRMLGSGSVELASVASGRLGLYVQYDCLPWDWYPGAALVRAAGGAAETVDAHGHRWHVAGARQVVDEAAALLAG
jgi:myo-inositol-1(or 4)-monophosphatase